MCVNPWGTIFFVCSKLEILFRNILCKCSQCWTKICYVPYPLQSCESGTGYNICGLKSHYISPIIYTIFSIQLYMYIFKKITPILSPIFLLEVTSSPEFGTLCWHQSGIYPVLEIAHSKLSTFPAFEILHLYPILRSYWKWIFYSTSYILKSQPCCIGYPYSIGLASKCLTKRDTNLCHFLMEIKLKTTS